MKLFKIPGCAYTTSPKNRHLNEVGQPVDFELGLGLHNDNIQAKMFSKPIFLGF